MEKKKESKNKILYLKELISGNEPVCLEADYKAHGISS